MGYFKNQEIEEMEEYKRGYSLPNNGKYVCASHFRDDYLKDYINKHSQIRECSYCGRSDKVISMYEFMQYVCEEITKYYANPDDDALYLASSFYDDDEEEIPGFRRFGSYVIPLSAETYKDKEDLLGDLGLLTGDSDLDSDIKSCLSRDSWVQKYSYSLTESQELSMKWESFARLVKHERRFTFFLMPEFISDRPFGDNGLFDILTELGDKITILKLIKELPENTTLYRCRFIGETEVVDSFKQITSAPDENARQSRMSPAGISMFYGAFDKLTAEWESSPDGKTIKGRHAVGEFKLRRPLRVLDLTELPIYSFWMPGDKEGVAFLRLFSSEITKQIVKDDRVHTDYVPSQVFTEYIRYIYKYENKNIDGIIYKSSLSQVSGKNIVLFYGQKGSEEVLKFVGVETIGK